MEKEKGTYKLKINQSPDIYTYEYDYDSLYCYPNSIVLKNKLNITDKELFFKAEREITSLRTTQALIEPVSGKFDQNHLKAIHKFLFSDIYSWAGNFRTVNISKGNSFCQTMFIEQELDRIFSELKSEKYLKKYHKQADMPQDLSSPFGKTSFARRLSYYMGEINAVHPFREGNGRTQRLFITYLARLQGYDIQFANITPKEMIDASYNSFIGDYDLLDSLMEQCLV